MAAGAGGGGDDLGRCGVGLFCEKERGSPAALVREVSARGSAARDGSIRPGDHVLSVDGADITQWTAATLRNALQGEQGSQVTLEISRNIAERDGEAGGTGDLVGGEGAGEERGPELAIMTVTLLRGSPMFWYWHDKHQGMVTQVATLTQQLQQAQYVCQQLQSTRSAAKSAAEERARTAEEELERVKIQSVQMREESESRIAALTTQLEVKQAEVEASWTRAQDELRASAVNTRQFQNKVAECENKILAKAHEFDRALAQRTQEHAEALMRATSHHQKLMRQVEEQLLSRNMEMETALNKQALEYSATLAQRVAAHAAELEKAKSRADAAQQLLQSCTQEHEIELECVRGELTARIKMCAVLDADKLHAEAEVDALTRLLADARDKLNVERSARTQDMETMAEERDRRVSDADSLHKRCLQALRAEMQRAGQNSGKSHLQ